MIARAVAMATLVLPACADPYHQLEPAVCEPWVAPAVDPAGWSYQYVVDSIRFPEDATEGWELGLDLDHDPDGRPNNALGQILLAITSQRDVDLNAETAQLVDAGELLHLLQAQASSLDDATGVGVLIAHGVDTDGDPADNFSGDERFGIDESRTTSSALCSHPTSISPTPPASSARIAT